MKGLFFVLLLSAIAQPIRAAEVNELKIKTVLKLKSCDDVLIDGKFQNCKDEATSEQDLAFTLDKNCKQNGEVTTCSSVKSVSVRLDEGSATATIVVSKTTKEGSAETLATILLQPGTNFSQQTVINMTLDEAGNFPPKLRLQAASYKPMGDSRIYFSSLVIQ